MNLFNYANFMPTLCQQTYIIKTKDIGKRCRERYEIHKIETKAIVYSQAVGERWSELTEKQIHLLQYIEENPRISRKGLARKARINQSATQEMLLM